MEVPLEGTDAPLKGCRAGTADFADAGATKRVRERAAAELKMTVDVELGPTVVLGEGLRAQTWLAFLTTLALLSLVVADGAKVTGAVKTAV